MYKLKIKIDESTESLNEYYKSDKYKTYEGDSGLDLVIPSEVVCKSKKVTFINHKVACEMIEEKLFNKKNVPFLLVPRSSLSKTPLIMANSIGIIDRGYRGNLIAAVYNTSNKDYVIYNHTRLFQVVHPSLCEFKKEIVKKLSKSERGDKGYGSSTSKTKNKSN